MLWTWKQSLLGAIVAICLASAYVCSPIPLWALLCLTDLHTQRTVVICHDLYSLPVEWLANQSDAIEVIQDWEWELLITEYDPRPLNPFVSPPPEKPQAPAELAP